MFIHHHIAAIMYSKHMLTQQIHNRDSYAQLISQGLSIYGCTRTCVVAGNTEESLETCWDFFAYTSSDLGHLYRFTAIPVVMFELVDSFFE